MAATYAIGKNSHPQNIVEVLHCTAKIILRPIRQDDEAWLYSDIFSSEIAMQMFRDGKTISKCDTRKFVVERCDRWYNNKPSCWIVEMDCIPIGFFSFCMVDLFKVETAYAYTPRVWNKGIASKVLKTCIYWLQDLYPEIEYVTATTHVDNAASIAVLKKNFFDLQDEANEKKYAYRRSCYFTLRIKK